MSEPNPADDAERVCELLLSSLLFTMASQIRLKRLAKLGGPAASSSSPRTPSTPSNSTQSAKVHASQRVPSGSVHQSTSAPAKHAPLRKPQEKAVVLDRALWTESTMEHIFLITLQVRTAMLYIIRLLTELQKGRAEASGWKMVWLKSFSEEIQAERTITVRPHAITISHIGSRRKLSSATRRS
jgi:ubiquitin conjugation factor E4 B